MEAKLKAEELFDKYWKLIAYKIEGSVGRLVIKQCALIAIDEIIKIIPYEKRQRAFMDAYYRNNTSYWEEVKEELNNL